MSPSSGFGGSCRPRYLSPFVFWAQTSRRVFLRVSLRNVAAPSIETDENKIEFLAHGNGATEGRHEFYFNLVFYKKIDPIIKVVMKDLQIEIEINKIEREWWPRLTEDGTKYAWLKLDFDKLKTDEYDCDEESDKDDTPVNQTLSQIQSRKKRYQTRVEDFRKIYLLLYNLSQFIGFLYVLIVLSIHYAKEGPSFMEKAYPIVKNAFNFCQFFQILEVLHPLLGYTSGSAIPPFLQVFGRMVMLVGMINGEPRIQSKPAIFYLIYIYSLSEVFRYPYYMLRVYKVNIGFISWLRYTIWIPLYPLGFLCEGIIILRNIPYFEETKRFSLFLPNAWNVSFYFPTIMRLYLLIGLFPLLYFMMTYMYRQRVKVLCDNNNCKMD